MGTNSLDLVGEQLRSTARNIAQNAGAVVRNETSIVGRASVLLDKTARSVRGRAARSPGARLSVSIVASPGGPRPVTQVTSR